MKRKSNTQFQMIADYDGDLSALMGTMETGEYPILATRNLVLFPIATRRSSVSECFIPGIARKTNNSVS